MKDACEADNSGVGLSITKMLKTNQFNEETICMRQRCVVVEQYTSRENKKDGDECRGIVLVMKTKSPLCSAQTSGNATGEIYPPSGTNVSY